MVNNNIFQSKKKMTRTMALELFAGRFSVGVTGSQALGPLLASRAVSGKLHRTERQRNSKEGSRRSMTL